MSANLKIKDGFLGEKLINIPLKIIKEIKDKNPELFKVYITEIGYFPKAAYHHRERALGCDDNILIYCLSGKGHYVIDGMENTVTSTEYIILPATDKYLRYWADQDDPWTIYWVHYTGDNIDSFNKSLNLTITKRPRQVGYNQEGIEIWNSIYDSLLDGYSLDKLCFANFSLYHMVGTFLFFDLQAKKKYINTDILQKTINYMSDNLYEKLTLKDMAKSNFLSVSHFSLLFKRSTGITPTDYFNQLKMQKACEFLFSNNDSIKLIAQKLGYDDPYHFSRLFKKTVGSAPNRYRRLSRIT